MAFYTEREMGFCGLACVLCSSADCLGCKGRGHNEGCDCTIYQCAIQKEIDGCYQCNSFPCSEEMFKQTRIRAFNHYARQFGKQNLLERLRINQQQGVAYHRADGLKGDYDSFIAEDDIMRLIAFGSHNPYLRSPRLETETFLLRLVQLDDAQDLLVCYSDPKAQELFNSDHCTSDFCYQTVEEMENCIRYWLREYETQSYIRFAIVNKENKKAVGTIEMFGMIGEYKTERGLLRLDIASSYEKEVYLKELFSCCFDTFFLMFGVQDIITKVIPEAIARQTVVSTLGLIIHDIPGREHYWLKTELSQI